MKPEAQHFINLFFEGVIDLVNEPEWANYKTK